MKQVSVPASESGSDGQNCSVYVILFSLTLSLLWCHLKTTSNGVQFEMFSFSCSPVNGFTAKHTLLKADLLQDWKIYHLQACTVTLEPRNLTGFGREGVKNYFV